MAPRKIVVVFAHPDDAEFTMGGTIAKWVGEGAEVHYVVLTDGSAGNNDVGAKREDTAVTREREQRSAAAVLGVKSCTFLGFTDGELELTLELRKALAREVRRLKPDLLVGPDPTRYWVGDVYINHIDHRVAGEAVLACVMPDAPSRPQFPELLEEGCEPWSIAELWLMAENGETFIDIAATIETKLAALREHRSQDGGSSASEELVRTRARHFGERASCEYAEAFRTFRLQELPETSE